MLVFHMLLELLFSHCHGERRKPLKIDNIHFLNSAKQTDYALQPTLTFIDDDGSFEALPQFPVEAANFSPAPNTASAPAGDKPILFYEVAKGNLSLDAFLAQMTDEELIACGVYPDMIRYSCGLEDAEDLTSETLLAALKYPKEIKDIKK